MEKVSAAERRLRRLADQLSGGEEQNVDKMRDGVGSSVCKSESEKYKAPQAVAPFHHAFPVHDLEAARKFYGTVMGCPQGREAPLKWIDYNLYGHQVSCAYFSVNETLVRNK